MRKTVMSLVCAFLVVSVSFSIAAEQKAAEEKKAEVQYGVKVGDMSQPVEVKTIDGNGTVSTGALKKPTVLLLVSSVCTSCTAELQEVSQFIDKFTDRDVYAVVIDMDPGRAAGSMSRWNIPLLSDADWKVGQAVGLASAPSVVVLGIDGKILYKKYGYQKGQWKEYVAAK